MSWSLVVPTCRAEQFVEFAEAWAPLFEAHVDHLVVVQDLEGHNADISRAAARLNLPHIELHHRGTIPDFHPRGTDMIRSAGIHAAWKFGSEFTLTLDDDVRPHSDLFFDHYERVFEQGAPVSDYLNVGALTTYGKPLRGFPFKDRELREVAVQYGGWHGILDYDAPTQLEGVRDQEWFEHVILPVPRGAAVTGCIMNCAWRTEYAPMMWQLPILRREGTYGAQFECYNRFGDIWSGLFQKRVCDALGVAMVVNGAASVRHERASDPAKNMEREAPGIPVNENLWDALPSPTTDGVSDPMAYAYTLVTAAAYDYFKTVDPEYAQHFLAARKKWTALFAD